MRLLPVAILATASPAFAGTVTGTVYMDEDGSGSLSPADRAVEGAVVYWETSRRAVTDAAGAYSIEVPDGDAGMIWVRAPDGASPAPVWGTVSDGAGVVDLGLSRADPDRRAGFVQASDTHAGKRELGIDRVFSAADMLDAFVQAIDPVRPPMFVVVTGDIATGAKVEHYKAIREATESMGVPFVPVPGNHDWYDDGANYRAHLGPPMYSFDAGGARFVVLNDNGDSEAWQRFLAADLADAGDAPVIGFIHRPPDNATLDALAGAGIDYLFSGHWHSNIVIEHGGLTEYNTQPLYSGGIDTTPGGYRVVELTAGGIEVHHHNVVSRGHARLVHPLGPTCSGDGDRLEVLAAIELGDGALEVEVEVGGQTTAMEPAGGWIWRASIDRPEPGAEIEIAARRGVEELRDRARYQPVSCAPPRVIGEWRQLQSNPANTGFTDIEIEPPLVRLWSAAVGGHVHGGSPVIAAGRVFVPISDFAGATSGGVVALDLASGRELWRRTTGAAVRNAPAVSGETVVIGRADGQVEALEVATGALRWSVDLGTGLDGNLSVLHAPPTIADGTIYIGVHRRFAALDLATGAVKWQIDPATSTTLTSLAGAAIRGDRVIGTVARGRQGLFTLGRDHGAERWRSSTQAAIGAHASPVAGGAAVYVANAMGEIAALDMDTGETLWTSPVVPSDPWDYAIVGTPALSRQRLYVPTQYDKLAAVRVADGGIDWEIEVGESPLRTAHTRTVARSFNASPVVTGAVLWVGGADGLLRAVDPDTGDQLWRVDLGAPITSGPAPAGEILVVAGYDGAVRALVKLGELPEPSGCGCGIPARGGALLGMLVLAALYRRRRRSGDRT